MDKVDPRNVRRSLIKRDPRWYHPAGTKGELERIIDGYLANVEDGRVEGQLIGLISPHAGYVYSGQVAAYAYKQLEGLSFEVVVVISPDHSLMYAGSGLAVTDKAYYETPLGLIAVDNPLVEAVRSQVSLMRVGEDTEHSLELQLPFLQRVLDDFKLIPIMMGDRSLSGCRALGQALAKVLKGKKALLVASTDMSHYPDYETACLVDRAALSAVESMDTELVARTIDDYMGQGLPNLHCVFCGEGPLYTVMLAAMDLGANKAKVLKYANSGDVSGDRTRVVGYTAVALYREGQE